MSIQPDHWIRRMAIEHNMIEPFVERQVRQGWSRTAQQLWLRHPRRRRVPHLYLGHRPADRGGSQADRRAGHGVPPAGKSASSRPTALPWRGRWSIPHPANMLTICLGKSTYARCFRGDTRVALVDGTAPTLEEMARAMKRANCSGATVSGHSVVSW